MFGFSDYFQKSWRAIKQKMSISEALSSHLDCNLSWGMDQDIPILKNDSCKCIVMISGWSCDYIEECADSMTEQYFQRLKKKFSKGWKVYQLLFFTDMVVMYRIDNLRLGDYEYSTDTDSNRRFVNVPLSRSERIHQLSERPYTYYSDYDRCGFHTDAFQPEMRDV